MSVKELAFHNNLHCLHHFRAHHLSKEKSKHFGVFPKPYFRHYNVAYLRVHDIFYKKQSEIGWSDMQYVKFDIIDRQNIYYIIDIIEIEWFI